MFRRDVPHSRTALWVLVSGAIVLSTWTALAARENPDRIAAQKALDQVQAEAAGSASPTEGPRQEARRALERADRARSAGDSVHEQHLEGLAREWADYAREVARADAAERDSAAAQSAAAQAALQVKRARALLEEQMARRARAQGELQRLRESGGSAVSPASISAMMAAPKASASAPPPRARPAGPAPKASAAAPGEEP